MKNLSREEVLRRIDNRLTEARIVLDDFGSTPGRQRLATSIAVSRLRSIWHIANMLDKSCITMHEWLKEVALEMNQDELVTFFRKSRDKDLKEGDDGLQGGAVRPKPDAELRADDSGITVTMAMSDGTRQSTHHPSPPGTRRKFFGDPNGGSGFEIEQPDGTIVRQYVPIPERAAHISVLYANPPRTHKGQPLEERSAKVLVESYYQYMVGFRNNLFARSTNVSGR